MSKLVTVSRPYAKAAFDFAVEHQTLAHWQAMLAFSAEISRHKHVVKLYSGVITPKKLAEVFILICGDKLDVAGQNFIRIIAENMRLMILPHVLEQFILLRSAQEGVIEVDVISVGALKKKQLANIRTIMEQRLSRKVTLHFKTDKSIMAGLIIRAGDMVIDSSVRGRLEHLADILQC